jgi:hypothetical protein
MVPFNGVLFRLVSLVATLATSVTTATGAATSTFATFTAFLALAIFHAPINYPLAQVGYQPVLHTTSVV